MEKKICPKCSSPKWMTGLQTVTPAEGALTVVRPTVWRSAVGFSNVMAEACGECGYLEHFLEKPQDVYDEWRKHNA